MKATFAERLRLVWNREWSGAHRPIPMEIWTQDDALVYIESSDATGVHLLSFDPRTRVVTRWTDTWDARHVRCRAQVVVLSGRTGLLSPWAMMVPALDLECALDSLIQRRRHTGSISLASFLSAY